MFFVGRGESSVLSDTVELDCDDSYLGLPEKVRSIARWAKEHEYNFMLKCDDDVVIRPLELLTMSGYQLFEYSGRANRPPQPYVVPMGFNYWLSKKCMGIVSEADLPTYGDNDDEKWVASVLWKHGISLTDDLRYGLHYQLLTPTTKRPLRAPRRPVPIEAAEPEYFSRCIHLPLDMDVKLAEFQRVFNRYVRGATNGQ
jgi:hypothetical protein